MKNLKSNSAGVTNAFNFIYDKMKSKYLLLLIGFMLACNVSQAACPATIRVPLNGGNLDLCYLGSPTVIKLVCRQRVDYVYQWLKGGNPIAGATARKYFPSTPGDYSVMIVRITDGCTNTSAAVTVFSSGGCRQSKPDDLIAAPLSIFPNPASGPVTITLELDDALNAEANIQVVNLLGEIVYTKTTTIVNGGLNEQILPDADLPSGNYFVSVLVGEEVFRCRMMYEK